MLSTENLSKRYGRFHALSGLNMHVPQGAIYGFVGQNGAGKTTLLRLICGLQRPTSGSFTLCGVGSRDRRIASARRRLGAVIESPAYYPDMTAAENLAQRFRMLGLPAGREGELLEQVGLAHTGGKKACHFSLGMRQRLGIAMALAGGPEFLALDEPTNGLDPQGIIDMRELLLRLNREQGITLLISSHILGELQKLATHYGFIEGGRMVREMSAGELESACRRGMQLEVSDMAAFLEAAGRMEIDYRAVSPSTVDVYTAISVTRLALALHESGCEVLTLHECGMSLEQYFISLTEKRDGADREERRRL